MISEPGEEASWFLVLSIPAGFILCLTWLFHRILSRFPFDFSGLWRWFTALIQMKFFEENFIFEVRVFIKIKIYSVTWFNVFKFCHFNSCQKMQHLFILLPNVVTPKFGILAINSKLFWKNGWQSLLYFYSTFKISLTCSLSLSISFCTLPICAVASCCSFPSFGKFEEPETLPGLEPGVGLAFFGFFDWGVSEDWCLGAMLGKKSPESSQGKREVLRAQRTLNIIFCFRKMLAFLFFCLSICFQEMESGRQTTLKVA